MTTALTREVDGLEQKMKEDVGSLRDDIELDMNNRKDETQSDSKAFEINVQVCIYDLRNVIVFNNFISL